MRRLSKLKLSYLRNAGRKSVTVYQWLSLFTCGALASDFAQFRNWEKKTFTNVVSWFLLILNRLCFCWKLRVTQPFFLLCHFENTYDLLLLLTTFPPLPPITRRQNLACWGLCKLEHALIRIKKWLLPLLQMESSDSVPLYIAELSTHCDFTQTISKFPLDWYLLYRFSVVTLITVSEATYIT